MSSENKEYVKKCTKFISMVRKLFREMADRNLTVCS